MRGHMASSASPAKADLSSLTAMLSAKWKSGGGEAAAAPDTLRTGQVRNFKISKIDTDTKRIEVTLA